MSDVYRFIAAEKANYPISLMSRLLGIRAIHGQARGVYGAPRIHAELRMAHGVRVSRKRVERLMRQAGISGLVPKDAVARRSACRERESRR